MSHETDLRYSYPTLSLQHPQEWKKELPLVRNPKSGLKRTVDSGDAALIEDGESFLLILHGLC